MWHEARKQEKKLREVMVNYQRRAERRREHYEKLVSRTIDLLYTCTYYGHTCGSGNTEANPCYFVLAIDVHCISIRMIALAVC